jgi:hypothetical protein
MRDGRAAVAWLALGAWLGSCAPTIPPPASETTAWRELAVSLPDYPKDEELLDARLGRPAQGYRYLVDGRSLGVGQDGVVRYTVVLASPGGARTVRHEGLRCQTREARLYGYDTGGQRLQAAASSAWGPLVSRGPDAYRNDLADFYFCTFQGYPKDVDVIRSRLASGQPETSAIDRGAYP